MIFGPDWPILTAFARLIRVAFASAPFADAFASVEKFQLSSVYIHKIY